MAHAPGIPRSRIDRINRTIRRSFITGIALTIPLIVTLLVLGFAFRTVTNAVEPVVQGVDFLIEVGPTDEFILEIFTLVLLFWFFFGVGFVAERRAGDDSRLARTFNEFMSSVPGVGSVYEGVQRMSEVMLTTDSQSFRDVKIVEFPHMDAFMLCFVTATPPSMITETTAQPEMETLFVPLAPNPVMGGFLTFVPTERIYDIDMSVEQGMQAVMTTGVSTDPRAEDVDLSPAELDRIEENGADSG